MNAVSPSAKHVLPRGLIRTSQGRDEGNKVSQTPPESGNLYRLSTARGRGFSQGKYKS